MKKSIQQFMAESGVAFGTSGARGLATAMTDRVCYAYTQGFLQFLEAAGEIRRAGEDVVVGGDLRPSTRRIMAAVCRAIADLGYQPVNGGEIPSPAVALFGFEHGIPSIMVTGSHIPDDRNGIKFNKCAGEILKSDEQGISGQGIELDDTLFDAAGNFPHAVALPIATPEVGENYLCRYLNGFAPDALRGLRVGVYQHSAVGRDMLVTLLAGLGADVTPLGRSETFIPVDTEAIRPEDVAQAAAWAASGKFNAIVSTDGDSDRPLVSDEQGRWLRGDVAGVLCAKFLQADDVSTPVSCNTVVERCGWFPRVRRTRIGSPYVVAAMSAATGQRIVGYEANGGFLLGSTLEMNGQKLRALPTRDALIVILGLLLLSRQQGKPLSQLRADLPARFTASDRLKNFAPEKSVVLLRRFNSGFETADKAALESVLGGICGQVATLDRTDGLRVTFQNDEIIHLRPSGNAPEFRCYAEAATEERAEEIIVLTLNRISNDEGLEGF